MVRTAVAIVILFGTISANAEQTDSRAKAVVSARATQRLELRVPFEPTAFPSAGRTHLFYELHIKNLGSAPVLVHRIEVFDAARITSGPVAAVEADQLNGILQVLGAQTPTGASSDHDQLSAGGSVIAFMSIVLNRGTRVPDKLLHRVVTAGFTTAGAVIGTRHSGLRVLGPPLQGADWLAGDGPSNDEDNHHRRGILVIDGRPVISRRYAIDWKQVKDGTSFSGDPDDKRSYYAYGKVVLAVADGRVITAKDGLPDNVPGHNEKFRPAVPITMETACGNTITLDVGGGQFAYYCHLQPGSLQVKAGDHVPRGQMLARVGDSGDAREPHLHLEVTTDPHFAAGEGVPYLIDGYRSKSFDDSWQPRTRELPLRGMMIEFGPIKANVQ